MVELERKMVYSSRDLRKLWNIIKNKFRTSPARYDPIGLIDVPFEIPFLKFESDFYERVRDHVKCDEALIFRRLDSALEFLEDRKVFLHHLCCAAECKSAYNSAVAIHLLGREKIERHKRYFIAIPGVNYVPKIEVVEEWKLKGRVDDEEYIRWKKMVEDFSRSKS